MKYLEQLGEDGMLHSRGQEINPCIVYLQKFPRKRPTEDKVHPIHPGEGDIVKIAGKCSCFPWRGTAKKHVKFPYQNHINK